MKTTLVGYRVGDKEENEIKNKEDEKILQNMYPNWYYEKIVKKHHKNSVKG